MDNVNRMLAIYHLLICLKIFTQAYTYWPENLHWKLQEEYMLAKTLYKKYEKTFQNMWWFYDNLHEYDESCSLE